MDLKITHYNNYFKLKGVLNRKNVRFFYNELNRVIDKVDTLTISLEGLESIDRHGVRALAKLHNEAISKNKRLSFIGMGFNEFYNHLKSHEAVA